MDNVKTIGEADGGILTIQADAAQVITVGDKTGKSDTEVKITIETPVIKTETVTLAEIDEKISYQEIVASSALATLTSIQTELQALKDKREALLVEIKKAK